MGYQDEIGAQIWLQNNEKKKAQIDRQIEMVRIKKVITERGLQALGFNTTRQNFPVEYYKNVPHLRDTKILVTFGDPYAEDGFIVWLASGGTAIAMKYIQTMPQLKRFYALVAGCELGK